MRIHNRLMIVDDDSIMRNYLRTLIDWKREGLEVVGEASDGKSAFSLIQEKMPDIVLLDIDMPVMNGVELIRKLYEANIKVKDIVLSCYDDFDYVREAMKYGACEYLLKHKVEPDEILKIVKSVMIPDQIDENRSFFDPAAYESKNVKSRIFHNIINRAVYDNTQQILNDFKNFRININVNSFIVIKVQIDYFNGSSELDVNGRKDVFNFTVLGIIEEAVIGKVRGEVVFAGDGQYMIICSPEEKSEITARRHIYELVSEVQSAIKKFANRTSSLGISPTGNNIMSLGEIYTLSNKALQYKLYKGSNSVIFYDEVDYCESTDSIRTIIQKIQDLLQESKDISLLVEELFKEIKMHKLQKDKFDLLMSGLQSVLYSFALKEGIEEVFGDVLEINILKKFETTEDYRSYFISRVEKINLRMKKETLIMRREVSESIEFMKNNLDKNISLKEVADHVNLSRAYFSQLFKQLTGENVTDFLTRLRLEKAKKLLSDPNIKVYEIALDIGFESQYYFNKLFKSVMGMTPTEFRNIKLYGGKS